MIATLLLASLLIQDPPSELRVQDLQAHIGFLASDELEGRESGERGEKLAVQYIVQQWERLGLKPIAPDGAYTLAFEAAGKKCTNTAALLPGTDPKLADQILVIGAHHDHAGIGGPGSPGGMGNPGEIHNGADDNASGTAGVIELAEWFAAHPTRRPILFMTFSAEERGLLGSADFVAHPPFPLQNIRAMLNCDMIGRSSDGYLFLGGLGTADEFHALLDPIIENSGLKVEKSDDGMAPSDNSSFHAAGVPALFFFTHIHPDYHMPGDDADKINYPGEVAVLQLVRAIVQAIQDHDGPLTFHERPEMGMPADFNERMSEHFQHIMQRRSLHGSAGLRVIEADGALVLDELREEAPARKAGLQKDDRLVSVNGMPVADKEQLRRALASGQKGEVVTIVVRRGGAERQFQVTLE
ncbi:MAG: M28 family peptidase [Planctomycetota bacterium]|nr:MAG: M28 family peptidase [Planctomycetota bacterium]